MKKNLIKQKNRPAPSHKTKHETIEVDLLATDCCVEQTCCGPGAKAADCRTPKGTGSFYLGYFLDLKHSLHLLSYSELLTRLTGKSQNQELRSGHASTDADNAACPHTKSIGSCINVRNFFDLEHCHILLVRFRVSVGLACLSKQEHHREGLQRPKCQDS